MQNSSKSVAWKDVKIRHKEISCNNHFDGEFQKRSNWRLLEHVKVTPFMMATNEIRRKDGRGFTPQHIVYIVVEIETKTFY
jgi:hypothetical protein